MNAVVDNDIIYKGPRQRQVKILAPQVLYCERVPRPQHVDGSRNLLPLDAIDRELLRSDWDGEMLGVHWLHTQKYDATTPFVLSGERLNHADRVTRISPISP